MAAIVESVHGDGPESKETELWQNMYVSFSQPARFLPKYVRESTPVRENSWDMTQGNLPEFSICCVTECLLLTLVTLRLCSL